MSGTVPTAPSPPRWTAMQLGESKPRDANFSGPLLGDTINGAGSVTLVITRRDGRPMTTSDLSQVGSPSLDSTGQVVSVKLSAGTKGGDYAIAFTVQTAGASTICRTAYQAVQAAVG